MFVAIISAENKGADHKVPHIKVADPSDNGVVITPEEDESGHAALLTSSTLTTLVLGSKAVHIYM